ncbi:heavy metal translocating P-type ATPase [Chitinophagaceae bacterium MMS25-I14]
MEQTYSAKVEGMTCGNCALTVSKLLEKKGMTHISVNAASGDIHFTADADAEVTKIYDAIDSLGYHVVRDEAAEAGHNHQHSNSTTILLIICAVFTVPLLAHMFVNWPVLHMPLVQFALATPVFAIGCYSFVPSAWRSLKHGIPNMDVLIMLGATAAYVYSLIGLVMMGAHVHQYVFFETTASIITLVMTGNWLESQTVRSTTVAINELAQLQPQFANIVMTDSIGKETIIKTESRYVRAGDLVLVNNGDSIPVDGEVTDGAAQVDEHMITGEGMPVSKQPGDTVVGGTLLQDGHLKIKATTVGQASVLNSILHMVREAQAVKPPLQKLADRISAVFVPAVLGIALVTLLINYFVVHLSFPGAMMRSIAVMVISCPCAMGLATPAAVAVGLGRAARMGILVKGGQTLEQMKTIRQIVFDKTGTLTDGSLQIKSLAVEGITEDEFRSVTVALEQHSSHPLAKSILVKWKDVLPVPLEDINELKGKGMQARDKEGNLWQLGSERWLAGMADIPAGFDLYLLKNKIYAGAVNVTDTLRKDAAETIAILKERGYTTILLSGDRREKCMDIAKQLQIDKVFAEQSPEQKNERLKELMSIAPTAMVGDGINDAPALAQATVGISLSDATHIAMQSANVILANNQLSSLPYAIKLGIYTDQTIRQNLFWAFIYNVIAIPVAAAGYLTPTWGAGIMALSDVVLIINSLRLGLRKL